MYEDYNKDKLPVKIVGPPTKIVLKTCSSFKAAISVKN